MAVDLIGLGSSGLVSGESARRIIVKGGGDGVPDLPAMYPKLVSKTALSSQGMTLSLRSARAQLSQNLRLVQKWDFRRSTFCPHCAQKFGLYIRR